MKELILEMDIKVEKDDLRIKIYKEGDVYLSTVEKI